ncbi:putative F-box protein At1g33530 [Neltuma alba]|uniref:putative F-box protein At1g33530 n=1 Tax=Neltuma alba TaxID=207710 RepID=UPI0010A59C5F|nr:putative F-box protein At1g33530 [Prosopis alba]
MKQRIAGGDTAAPYLHEEIIRQILKRLPVKSLIRFQCVSERWKNLIKSPSFIDEHLHYSTHQNPSLLLRKSNGRFKPLQLRLMDSEMHVREVQNPPLPLRSLLTFSIVGSCNGLVCAEIDGYDKSASSASFLLWNPATGDVRKIPTTRSSKHPYESVYVGFGFSTIVNDYKIVQIYDGYDGDMVIEVYSLSIGSWKEIESESLKGVSPSDIICNWVTVNGRIFWDAATPEDKEDGVYRTCLILSFDIALEVFTVIPGPPQLDVSGGFEFTLSAYDDNKLAIIYVPRVGRPPKYLYSLIHLWVLEEKGTSSSTERWIWTKIYTSNPCPAKFDVPRTMWGNKFVFFCIREPSLTNESGGEMENRFSLSIITNEGKIFEIPQCYGSWALNHVESLVPVGNIHFEEP